MLSYRYLRTDGILHKKNAFAQEFFRDYRYSTDPDKLTSELSYNIVTMTDGGYTYIGDRWTEDKVPASLVPLYKSTQTLYPDKEIDDKDILLGILHNLGDENSDLDLCRNTVQNINSKQISFRRRAWFEAREEWATSTVLECGLYVGLYVGLSSMLRRRPPVKTPL